MPYQDKSFSFEGMESYYTEGGAGLPVLLIHGSGPGASTAGNWRLVLEPLAAKFHVFAMDLIGFGKSGRKTQEPYFDFDMWLRQCQAMVAMMPGGEIGVLGHSLSGALALKLAAAEPRVSRLLTTASMGAAFEINEGTRLCWTYPDTVEKLRQVAGYLVHDKSLIDDAYIAAREKVLYGDPSYGAYFTSMFGAAKETYAQAALVGQAELAKIACPVTMMHGRNDEAFPASITLDLARHIPQADVILLAACSHSIALEHTDRLLNEADLLFGA